MQAMLDRIAFVFGAHAVTPALLLHQHDGVRQLVALLHAWRGALLADIMGLGKTLQAALAMVGHVAAEEAARWEAPAGQYAPLPVLVVAPPSAHPEWRDTLGRLLQGSATFQFVLTTPHVGKLKALADTGSRFSGMVVDEAHQVLGLDKEKSSTWKELLRVRALVDYGVLLATGTPLNASNPCKSFAAIVTLLPGTRAAVAQSVTNATQDPSTEAFWWRLLRTADTLAVDTAAARLWDLVLVRRTHADLQTAGGAAGGTGPVPLLLPPPVPEPETLSVEVELEADMKYFDVCWELMGTLEKLIPMLNDKERHRLTPEKLQAMKTLLHTTFALLHNAQAVLMWGGEPWRGDGGGGGVAADAAVAAVAAADDADADADVDVEWMDGDGDGNGDGVAPALPPTLVLPPAKPLSVYLDRVLRSVLEDVLVHNVGVFVTCFWIDPLDQLHRRLAEVLGNDAVAFVQGKNPVSRRGAVVQGVREGRIKVVLMTSGCAVGLTLIELKRVYKLGVALDMAKEKQAVCRTAGRVGQTAGAVRIIEVTPTVDTGKTTVVQLIQQIHRARSLRDEGLMTAAFAAVLASLDDDKHTTALLVELFRFLHDQVHKRSQARFAPDRHVRAGC